MSKLIQYNNEVDIEWFAYRYPKRFGELIGIQIQKIEMQVPIKCSSSLRDMLIETKEGILISLEVLIRNKKGYLPSKHNIMKHIEYYKTDISIANNRYFEISLLTDFKLDSKYKSILRDYCKNKNCTVSFIELDEEIEIDKNDEEKNISLSNKLIFEDLVEFYPNKTLEQIREFFLAEFEIKTFHNFDSLKYGIARANAGKDKRRFEYSHTKIELKEDKRNFIINKEILYKKILNKFDFWKVNKNKTGLFIDYSTCYHIVKENKIIFHKEMYLIREIVKKTYYFLINEGL